MRRQGECCHELTGNSVCIAECKILRQGGEHALPASAFSSQRFVCFWTEVTDDKQYSSLEGDSLSAHLPCSAGEARRFVLSPCFLEWAAICALFRKERNTTNSCTKFPRWVQLCRRQLKQPGFVFIEQREMMSGWLDFFLSFFCLSVHLGIEGRLAVWGFFYLRFGWQFSVSLPLPLQMTSCESLLTFWVSAAKMSVKSEEQLWGRWL